MVDDVVACRDFDGKCGGCGCASYGGSVRRDFVRIASHIAVVDGWDVACHESSNVVKRRLAFVTALAPYLKALGLQTVLDVGCAGITRDWWIEQGLSWSGATFPRDAEKLRSQGIAVDVADAASLPYPDGAFDLIYASHVMEHSVMPLIALMEARRVGRALALAVPRWPRTLNEPYHYGCAPAQVWKHWLTLAGWRIAANFTGRLDYQFLCTQADKDAEVVAALSAEIKKAREERRARRKKARSGRRKALRRR